MSSDTGAEEAERRVTQDTLDTYNAIAADYADRWFDFRLVEDMARFTGRLGPGARVLDVGCGPGQDVAWLCEQGFEALGVDRSFGMLAEGRARGVTAPLILADMGHLPFRKGSFRGLWVCASLLHIAKDRASDVLGELARVVYPGHIYLSVKSGEGQEWVEDEDGRRRFFAYYHPAEIQLLMERSGFEVLSCHTSEDVAGRKHDWINVLAWSKMRTPRVGVSAVLFDEAGDVLLTRRADNGRWCLPGGHMDLGETVEQCVVREVYEETGLRVEVERLGGIYSYSVPAGDGRSQPAHYVIMNWLCRRVGGEVRLSDETTEMRAFPVDELPDGLWPWHRQRIVDALEGSDTPFIR